MNLIVALLSSYISPALRVLGQRTFSRFRKRYDIISNEIANTRWISIFFFTLVYELKKERIMNIPFFDNDIFKRVYSFHATKYFWLSLTLLRTADGKFLYTYNAYTFDTIITKGTLTKQVALHCFVES